MHCSRIVPEVRVFTYLILFTTLIMTCRCTVPLHSPETLGTRRTREHSELLVTELELGVLWEDYGLVGDIVASIQFNNFGLCFHVIDSS